MDINDFKVKAEPAVMPLLHPTTSEPLSNDDGTPMTITLLGIDSKEFKKADQASINRRLVVGGRRGGGTITAEEIEVSAIYTLAASTSAWNITLGGAKPECTLENATALYRSHSWIREQADTFNAARSNFMEGSKTD